MVIILCDPLDMFLYALDGGGRSWNLLFSREFNDWEMGRFYSFFEHVSARIPRGESDDVLIWQLSCSGIFDVCSFYNYLLKDPSVSFPWQSIWCIKVPERVSFFLWTVARGGILTIDNLVKKNLPLVNWCCLCRYDEETVDHFLLDCKFARALWSEVLCWGSVSDAEYSCLSSFCLEKFSSNIWNMYKRVLCG